MRNVPPGIHTMPSAGGGPGAVDRVSALAMSFMRAFSRGSEDGFPVARHAHLLDPVLIRLVERFRERTQPELAIVRGFARGVIVVEQQREPRTLARKRVPHHCE